MFRKRYKVAVNKVDRMKWTLIMNCSMSMNKVVELKDTKEESLGTKVPNLIKVEWFGK